ncbi:MAG TPA: class I SAM-dependent methyltransferase [Candidatus Dormibacteraeota bacterium]|nr:class I SAM-dependent methyltransferase [Candidatus Dormibacteraeota bacterium]
MSILYRLMYRLGFTPWDNVLPAELVDAMTGPNALPRGRALDMGSGKGGKAVYMAQSGWQVTAVENVPRAVAEARRRATAAGVTVDFHSGDVTRLEDLHLSPGYSLVFDFGCYHGLNRSQREAYGRGVNSVTAPGATFLVMGFTRALPPVPSGINVADLTEHLGQEWRLQWTHAVSGPGTPAMSQAEAAWFSLTRT